MQISIAEEVLKNCLKVQYNKVSTGNMVNPDTLVDLIYNSFSVDTKAAIIQAMQSYAQQIGEQEYNRGWNEACDKIESKRYDIKGEDGYIHHAITQQSILSLKIQDNEPNE